MINKVECFLNSKNNQNILFKSNDNMLKKTKDAKEEKDVTNNGLDTLAAYNYPAATKGIKTIKMTPEMVKKNNNYMKEVEQHLKSRDRNKDGKITTEEVLANYSLKYDYPDLYEKDKEVLKKYAMSDNNAELSKEEYIYWLDGKEHEKILNESKVRDAEIYLKNKK